ncbi:MAG: DNA alkylation repair protein [Candidatus Aminicenantes bacterium]|nr:MAG: DNA alkylation repair protein [Candidatus Aminicenantes bacterium]
MPLADEILQKLKAKARPDQLEGMARFAIAGEGRLGVSVPEIRKIAKYAGKNHGLALELWNSEIPDARIVAGLVGEPDKLTEKQMEDWAKDFDSWDVCDQVCMNLFDRSPLAMKKIHDWADREEEFVKRAAFALIASLSIHDKKAEDEKFTRLFPVIKDGAADERNFVKKAVNWALRSIGKRNPALNKAAIKLAQEIKEMDSKSARWIANDALRELEGDTIQQRLRRKFGDGP